MLLLPWPTGVLEAVDAVLPGTGFSDLVFPD
jgi:hypothetical protein